MNRDLFALMLGESPQVSRSVSQSVSQHPLTDLLTRPLGVGEAPMMPVRLQEFTPAQRAFVGDALAQIVGEPLREVQPVAEFGRVIVVAAIPTDFADPVLPLFTGYGTPAYYHHYQEYWRAISARSMGWPVSRRRFRSLARRISLAVAPLLTPHELAWFNAWLGHGVLGETAWK